MNFFMTLEQVSYILILPLIFELYSLQGMYGVFSFSNLVNIFMLDILGLPNCLIILDAMSLTFQILCYMSKHLLLFQIHFMSKIL